MVSPCPNATENPAVGDGHVLFALRPQVHFDAARPGVPARLVAQPVEREVRAQLAIDSRQQIQVESPR